MMTPGHRRHLLSTVSQRTLVFMRPMHPARVGAICFAAYAILEKEKLAHVVPREDLPHRGEKMPRLPKVMGRR